MTPPPRYPQQQRDAIVSAVLDGECSVLEALRRAEAGALPGVGRFSMHRDAAYRAVAQAREKRDQHSARTNPLNAIPDLARDLLAATVREGRRLEKAAKQGEYDADAIRAVTRNTQELHKLLRYTDPTSPEQAGKGKDSPAPAPTRPIASLLQEPQTTEQQHSAANTHAAEAAQDVGQATGSLPHEPTQPATEPALTS